MTDQLVDYVHRLGVREHPVLAALREETAKLPEHEMQIGPDQGAFMALLVRNSGATRILEIGTFTGYISNDMALDVEDVCRMV
jgi:predicted O-methyltransferase YrrM